MPESVWLISNSKARICIWIRCGLLRKLWNPTVDVRGFSDNIPVVLVLFCLYISIARDTIFPLREIYWCEGISIILRNFKKEKKTKYKPEVWQNCSVNIWSFDHFFLYRAQQKPLFSYVALLAKTLGLVGWLDSKGILAVNCPPFE